MVTVSSRDADNFCKNIPENIRAVLVCGRDEGLIRERADRISVSVVSDLSDPFNVSRPTMEGVEADLALLGDEMNAISMMGGRRLVRLDGATEKAIAACELVLEQPASDSLLVVTAGDLSKKSKLRKLFEGHANAGAVICYSDSDQDVGGLVTVWAQEQNLTLDKEVRQFLVQNLGGDRAVSRSELDKIALYKLDDRDRALSIDDIAKLVDNTRELAIVELAVAITGGSPQLVEELLSKAEAYSEGAIGILRVLQWRLQRFHLVRGLLDEGMSLNEATRALVPPLNFPEKEPFLAHIQRWSSRKIALALDLISKAEVECKSTGMPDFTICARLCLSLAASRGR